jgi:mannitol-1-phosphate/altronate dehydrogenase
MVDRITPNTTEADTAHIAETYGYEDAWSVVSEDFLQWVIEPNGLEGLPDFSKAGVIITDEVESYEVMKIRLLNGSHSALAYPAYLLGYTRVDEAMSDGHIRMFIREWYMNEVGKSVPSIEGFDQEAYKDQLIARFQNPSIKDTLLRLAQDGSKKFTNALIPALQYALRNHLPLGSMVLALVFWIHFLETADPSVIDDGQKQELLSAASVIESEPQQFFSLIGISVEQGSVLKQPLLTSLEQVNHDGIAKVLSTRT